MENWKDLVVTSKCPIIEVLKILDKEGSQFVVVVDNNGGALGTITDGDIRRGLMKNVSLQSECRDVMNTSFFSLSTEDSLNSPRQLQKIKENKIRHVPILNASKVLVAIKSFEVLSHSKQRENQALILAGGLGSRLGELTKACPKPLLKVAGTPILETILLSLRSFGISRVSISVNYLSHMIEDYFENGSQWGVEITYIKEEKRLGTAGPLSLLREESFVNPLLVLNGDLITKVDLGSLLDFHNLSSKVATMCVRQFEEKIPYGVVEFEDSSLIKIIEKPVNYYHVNAGIYVLSLPVREYVPHNTYFDINNLFETLIECQQQVGVFPIHESWVDVGRPDDLRRMRKGL